MFVLHHDPRGDASLHIDQIHTFLDLVETGNFHRTAERLDINQSTVSFRVRALERALGARLFVRGRGGAELTAEGRRFERYATNLLQGWNLARQDVGMPAGFEGRLRVGMQIQLADRLVDSWATALRRQLPGTALHVVSDYSRAMTEQLVFGNLDVAVLYDPEQRPELQVSPVFDECFRMVATRPAVLDAITPPEYIRIRESPYFQARHAEQLPHLQQPALSVETGAMALTCLRAMHGAAYLPQRLADTLTATGELCAVEGAPLLHQRVHVAHHARNRRHPGITTAVGILRGLDVNAAPPPARAAADRAAQNPTARPASSAARE